MGAEQVPGDGTRGQSESVLQEIELSSVQSPQEAETGGLDGGGVGAEMGGLDGGGVGAKTGGLDGGGVGSTGKGVYQRIAYHHIYQKVSAKNDTKR